MTQAPVPGAYNNIDVDGNVNTEIAARISSLAQDPADKE